MRKVFTMTDLQIFAEIQRSLGRLEGKLDRVVEEVKANNDNHTRNDGDMDKRLRKVEGRQYYHSGVGMVLGAFGTYLLSHWDRFWST